MLKCDTWFYRGQESRLVREGNEAPTGWTDEPEVPFAADGEYAYVIEEFHTPKKQEEAKRGPGRPPKVDAAPEQPVEGQ